MYQGLGMLLFFIKTRNCAAIFKCSNDAILHLILNQEENEKLFANHLNLQCHLIDSNFVDIFSF